jgi:NADPH2:quinone reductase
MFVSFGMQSGPPPPVDLAPMRWRGSFYLAAPVGAHHTTGEGREQAFSEILGAMRPGHVKVEVKHQFRLDQAREAQQAMQARATTGPIVLIP